MTRPDRLLGHERVSSTLTLLSDTAIGALLDGHARPGAAGIGGHTATAEEFRGPSQRAAVLRGEAPFLGPPAAADLMRRYASRALVTDAFFHALVTGAKTTPYPVM